jgi:hypothetical protein
MCCIELPHRGVNLYLSIDSLDEDHVAAARAGSKVSADRFVAGVEPGFAAVIERAGNVPSRHGPRRKNSEQVVS